MLAAGEEDSSDALEPLAGEGHTRSGGAARAGKSSNRWRPCALVAAWVGVPLLIGSVLGVSASTLWLPLAERAPAGGQEARSAGPGNQETRKLVDDLPKEQAKVKGKDQEEETKAKNKDQEDYTSDRPYNWSRVPAGNGQRTPREEMKVWCDFNPCSGETGLAQTVRGVNYGGRFIPENYLGLHGTTEYLFTNITKPEGAGSVSLCDVNTTDAGERMSRFLDDNIKKEHFETMRKLGFNVVRLPLGYWNLIDLPGTSTPSGPGAVAARWRNLQNMMKAEKYMKWIDRVFEYAKATNIQVLMDLHHVPGGQSGNENTGCDLGGDGTFYSFNKGTSWNSDLGVRSIEAMGKICAAKKDTCWGIELLNEPFGAGGGMELRRKALAIFYDKAIVAARKHMPKEKPIVIMEWCNWLWFWRDLVHFSYHHYGRIVFSTHVYEYPQNWTNTTSKARASFKGEMEILEKFFKLTRYEILITEYALNSHGTGGNKDNFDYHNLTAWFVGQFIKLGFGSMVWNFDSWYTAWGPVKSHENVGNSSILWDQINADENAKGTRGLGWGRGRGRGRFRGANRGLNRGHGAHAPERGNEQNERARTVV